MEKIKSWKAKPKIQKCRLGGERPEHVCGPHPRPATSQMCVMAGRSHLGPLDPASPSENQGPSSSSGTRRQREMLFGVERRELGHIFP